jgi:uncharacterized protein (TIGR04255 family)
VALPIEIDPCPIVDVVADLRFKTTLPDAVAIGLAYQNLTQRFPKVVPLPVVQVPDELVQLNPALAYRPQFRFESEDFVALLGPNIFAVGVNGPYPRWNATRKGFNEVISLFRSTSIVETLHRFGLKYVNFFPGNVLPELELMLAIRGAQVPGEGTFIKTIVPASSFKIQLQVHNEAKITSQSPKLLITRNLPGTIIELDCYQDYPPSKDEFLKNIEQNLEAAHTQEKELFFRLLKDEFLQTLHPRYQ